MLKVNDCRFLYSVVDPESFKDDPYPQIAFAGRSNVGKSSLLNRLVGRANIARVSKSPGRTRAINFFLVNERIMFVDLPGYGYAKVSKTMRESWGLLIESYLAESSNLRGIVQLVDSRHPPTELDRELNEWMNVNGLVYKVVMTKADKLSKNQLAQSMKLARQGLILTVGSEPLPFSAKTGMGKAELLAWIESRVQ